jgi:hypothetical protein
MALANVVETPRTKVVRHQLSNPQVVALADWIAANRDWLLAAQPDVDTVVRMAGTDLKFKVSPANVQTSAKIRGIAWPAPKVEVDREDVRAQAVVEALRDLYAKIGEDAPNDVLARIVNPDFVPTPTSAGDHQVPA